MRIVSLLPLAHAQDPAAPDVLVKNVTLEVIDIIAKDKEIRSGDRTKLIGVIDAKVLPHFNFASMTALAMGQNWNNATPEQKKQLVDDFRTLLVRTYASALAAYSEQKFDFRPLRAKPTDTDVTVQVRVIQPGAQPVPIDYSMEKTAARLEGLRRDGRRRQPGRQLPHRVRQRGAQLRRRRPDQGDLQAKNKSLRARRNDPPRGRPAAAVAGRSRSPTSPQLLGGGPPRSAADGVATVDLAGVTELDSSALALLLAWLREAKRRRPRLAFANLPEGLRTIARLYGVDDLLPAARLNAIEVRGVEKRYGRREQRSTLRARRRHPGRSPRASSSACSGRTAPARPR